MPLQPPPAQTPNLFELAGRRCARHHGRPGLAQVPEEDLNQVWLLARGPEGDRPSVRAWLQRIARTWAEQLAGMHAAGWAHADGQPTSAPITRHRRRPSDVSDTQVQAQPTAAVWRLGVSLTNGDLSDPDHSHRGFLCPHSYRWFVHCGGGRP
ncbi:hypothetical protein GCM10010286_53930 [Streptomyces toxytricini]|nr:hypothetical protein GCM10010286_53930 [Streptomyces toxytricini]